MAGPPTESAATGATECQEPLGRQLGFDAETGFSHERQSWAQDIALNSNNPFDGYSRRPRNEPDPEVLSMTEYLRNVLSETRDGLRGDWERQDRSSGELHTATVALFESLQEAHHATRRRVFIEMTGLAIVMVGTVVSSLPDSSAAEREPADASPSTVLVRPVDVDR